MIRIVALLTVLFLADSAAAQTLIPRTPDDRVMIVWDGRTFYQPRDFVPPAEAYAVDVRGGYFVDMGKYQLVGALYTFVSGPIVWVPEVRTPGNGYGYIVTEGRWTDGRVFVSEWGERGRGGVRKYLNSTYSTVR